jgi:arylformamidase
MIEDWDDAYRNGKYIADGDSYPARWATAADGFCKAMSGAGRARLDLAYGPRPRHRLDLFLPEQAPRGLAIFIHGGYWLAFDKSSWSHLAAGAVARGWAVALPSYTLAPEARVADITREAALAIAHAAGLVAGPIRLAGHSAGGHLVSRMACRNAPLDPGVQARLDHVLSISGVHDLRPLLRTAMADQLFAAPGDAAAESPALLEPAPNIGVTCWVGAEERPEFLRQNDLLANIWAGLGCETRVVHAAHRHHFDVIDGLADAASPLTARFVSGG